MKVSGTNLQQSVIWFKAETSKCRFLFSILNDEMLNVAGAEFWLQLDRCNSSDFSGTTGFDARTFQTCLF